LNENADRDTFAERWSDPARILPALIGVLRTVAQSASKKDALHPLAIQITVGHVSVLRNTPIKAQLSDARTQRFA
jgi:hypothetical protein